MINLPHRLWMHTPNSKWISWPSRDKANLVVPVSSSLFYAAVGKRSAYSTAIGEVVSIEGHQGGKWTPGYVILCKAVNIIFQLRLADEGCSRILRNWKNDPQETDLKLSLKKVEDDFPDFQSALLSTYQHTQVQLEKVGQKYIRLYRNIGNGIALKAAEINSKKSWDSIGNDYDLHFLRAYASSKKLGNKYLWIHMDLLSSFSDDGAYGHYEIRTYVDVRSELVLYTERFLGAQPPCQPNEYSIEGNEWVIMNPALDGLAVISLHDDAVSFSKDLKEVINNMSFSERCAYRYLESWICGDFIA